MCRGKSQVLVNGNLGIEIRCCGGLRRGGPLSPLIFTFVADVLTKMVFECQYCWPPPIVWPPNSPQMVSRSCNTQTIHSYLGGMTWKRLLCFNGLYDALNYG